MRLPLIQGNPTAIDVSQNFAPYDPVTRVQKNIPSIVEDLSTAKMFPPVLGIHPAVALPVLGGLTTDAALTGAQWIVDKALRAVTLPTKQQGCAVGHWPLTVNVLCLIALGPLLLADTAGLRRDRAAVMRTVHSVNGAMVGFWICVRLTFQGYYLMRSIIGPDGPSGCSMAGYGTGHLVLTIIVLSVAPKLRQSSPHSDRNVWRLPLYTQ